MNEPHVEHPVGLVEHQILHRTEIDEPLADEVDEPARGGNQHVDAPLHRGGLRPLAHAAVDHRRRDARKPPVGQEALVNLAGEFPRGGEHQRPAAPSRGPLVVGPHPLDQREREGGRFAGARLGAADQVAAGEQGRHRPDLDRRGH